VLLRETWELESGWDDTIPPSLHRRWVKFLTSFYDLGEIVYPRALKPNHATTDPPVLVLLSDASEVAYGFAAYVRWLCTDESYYSRLVMAKSLIAPLRKRSIPQLELNAAVLSKRGREVITLEMRYKFSKILQLVDSETVLAMLQKTSTRFKLYEGVRIGEIQAATDGDISCWSWVSGTSNIADWLTRGKDPSELGESSEWMCGPSFLSKPVEEWGLKSCPVRDQTLPGEKKIVSMNFAECQVELLKYSNYSRIEIVLRILARILNMIRMKKVIAFKENLTPQLLKEAEEMVVKNVQRSELES
jgi:hypothetical protein